MPGAMQDLDNLVIDYMIENKMKVTRENYIALNWGANPPKWTAELEAELPKELQDWSKFSLVDDELVLTG